MGYRDRLDSDGPRKLLALDGGGIRGVLTLEILAAIEDIVRTKLGKAAVLADYFDYIAGTSMGALIGGLYHMVHAWLVTRRAQAAGHVRKPAAFSKGLGWHELTDHGRHHLKRAFIWLGAFFALTLLV